jgi:ubiquitin-protein ligase
LLLLLLLLLLPGVQLAGPQGSPYEGGWFNVELKFTKDFPGVQPQATFNTQIWHPNVEPFMGGVCMSLGKRDMSGRLTGVCSITRVLVGLQMLLASPNPYNPMEDECAWQMVYQPEASEEKARAWTRKYAM